MKPCRRLTPKQLEILTEVFERQRSGKTLTAIAKDMGVSRRNIYNWRKSEEWIEMERQLKEKLISDAYFSVMDTLVRRAIEGRSPKFIELYLKTQGKLKEQDNTQVHVNNNIVQDGVSDEFLRDLDAILKGE
ncbi:hypothetical protein DN407_25345 [Bacillus sp. JAS24-2]|uniref:phBC6A51 family helix-turn-helix protein n=1 Tax=Bacillus sp. JAS24-2 TaxID=2217832 RepID=UPI0011EFCBF2|nr:phBC6A51 family helix-turn-helix protein [Bacillus sp. JAS24-2]QEL81782.1 hypothetical protein DN407_25345 [Bacillus sp. JAS24-2]